MDGTSDAGYFIVSAQESGPVPATSEPVVNEPEQNSFASGFITIGEVLTDSAPPGTEWLHALFDKTAAARVACSPAPGLIGAVCLGRKAEPV